MHSFGKSQPVFSLSFFSFLSSYPIEFRIKGSNDRVTEDRREREHACVRAYGHVLYNIIWLCTHQASLFSPVLPRYLPVKPLLFRSTRLTSRAGRRRDQPIHDPPATKNNIPRVMKVKFHDKYEESKFILAIEWPSLEEDFCTDRAYAR